MKKQLFFVLVLAIFAGINTVNAQNCTPSALAPVAGVAYDYTATISGSGYTQAAGAFTWYVTTNPDLLSSSGVVGPTDGIIIASGAGAYNSPIIGANGITIEWTSQAILNAATTPYYLVIKYAQANSTATPSCDAMNVSVWEIKPINKFLLAVASFTGTVGQSGVYCAANVTGAVVTPGTTPTVQYTYGSNTLYAKVTASNYVGAWTPSFQISGLAGDQAVTSVSWDSDSLGTYAKTTTLASGVYTSSENATAAYDGSTKLYVKVVVANNNYSTTSDETITIAVDGIIPATTPLNDVISASNCNPETAFGKSVNQTIKARPIINPGTGSFITKNP